MMASTDPALYKELGEADLLIFQGDLNCRKLDGDLNWETSAALKLHCIVPALRPPVPKGGQWRDGGAGGWAGGNGDQGVQAVDGDQVMGVVQFANIS